MPGAAAAGCGHRRFFSLRLIHVKDGGGATAANSRRCRARRLRLAHVPPRGKVISGEILMSDSHDDNEKVPLMQRLLDNPFLLLFLGVLVPMLLYTLWGVIDILTIPAAK